METAQNKEDKPSIQLSMATVPQSPTFDTQRFGPRKSWLPSGYAVLRFVQQSGIILLIAGLSLASYFVISHYLLQTVEVVGQSMSPTLHEKSHYLMNRWTLRNREPQHSDVVVIRDPGDHGFSVKRIVAVEGDSIFFKNGSVFVNGKELNEPYLKPGTHTYTYARRAWAEMITCGKGQYFVLGDNRSISVDSRSYGPVSRQDILGLVMLN